jgi:hypothetical protein
VGELQFFGMLVKLFGVQRSPAQPEDQERSRRPPFLIHPASTGRIAWEIATVVLILYSCLEAPHDPTPR